MRLSARQLLRSGLVWLAKSKPKPKDSEELGQSGFGPYRFFREGHEFVGTRPSVLKYHVLADKTPEQSYGIQGSNHLLPGKGKVYAKLPTKMLLKKDKVYAWCSCGYSSTQPLCDGSHNIDYLPDKGLRPVRFIPDRDMEVWFCNCKQTKTRPFCDGTHRSLRDATREEMLFGD